MIDEEMILTQIKTDLELLAKFILDFSGEYREYSDENLFDAMIVFTEILLAKTHKYYLAMGMGQQQLEVIAEELGKNLHQTVLLATGVDLKKVYEKETATTGGENGESESS